MEQASVSFIEKWIISFDSKSWCGTVLMDTLKAFDTINHDLQIARLHVYGFDKSSLKFLSCYLS